MNLRNLLWRVIRSNTVQPVLAVWLVFAPYAAAQAQPQPAPAQPNPYAVLMQNQIALAKQNEQLRRQLAEMQLTLKGMVELQAKLSAPKEARTAMEAEERKKASEAAEHLKKEDADFGSKEGKEFREKLREDAKFLQDNTITFDTKKEDVVKVIARVQDAQQRIIQKKGELEGKYQKAKTALQGTPLGALVAGMVTDQQLAAIPKDRLLEGLRKLDPKISKEELERLEKDAGALYSKVREFSASGRWSPELVAAYGSELAKIAGLDPMTLPPEAREFLETAQTAVDVYRAAADFASFAIPLMEAAISTGNPWVIAGAAVLLALIALFKLIFGGGGGSGGDGGDGKGKGKGKGEGQVPGQNEDVSRNTGTGGPPGPMIPTPPVLPPGGGGRETKPVVAPPPTGSVVLSKDPDGPYRVYKLGGQVVVEKKEGTAFTPYYTIKLDKIVKGGKPFAVAEADVKELTGGIESKTPKLVLAAGSLFLMQGTGEVWIGNDAETKPVPGSDPKAKYVAVQTATSLVITDRTTGEEVVKVDAGNVFFDDPNDGGKRKEFGFKPTDVVELKSFDPDKKQISLSYTGKDGKPTEARLEQNREKPAEWKISGTYLFTK
jgi:hypothetical protein